MTVQFDQVDEKIATSVPVGKTRYVADAHNYVNKYKRVLDLALIFLSAFLVVPVILILALIVSLDGGKPFYRSTRVGRYGQKFGMLKLRTMVKGAEGELADHLKKNAQAREEWDTTQKLKKDPRVTAFGRFLRKSSLDELPQLWNVFRGEMSLVGPRPMLPEQRAIYPGTAYYALRPGLTGPWQVSDRNSSEFSKRAAYDSDYEKNVSLSGDLKLILRTFTSVLRGTGY